MRIALWGRFFVFVEGVIAEEDDGLFVTCLDLAHPDASLRAG